jgi:hypothetical protein
VDLKGPIKEGIKQACYYMLKIPMPIFGVKGIRFLAKRVQRYPEKVGDRRAGLYLGNIIRMQEEIGTGGAGFRFMYAAFLLEAGALLQNEELKKIGKDLTAVGDLWRNFAFEAGRVCKARAANNVSYKELGNMLLHIADEEEKIFRRLSNVQLA